MPENFTNSAFNLFCTKLAWILTDAFQGEEAKEA
jgi:hypothetical protein